MLLAFSGEGGSLKQTRTIVMVKSIHRDCCLVTKQISLEAQARAMGHVTSAPAQVVLAEQEGSLIYGSKSPRWLPRTQTFSSSSLHLHDRGLGKGDHPQCPL